MNCEETLAKLDDCTDGVLLHGEHEEVTQHLASCKNCQQIFAREEALKTALQTMPVPEVRAGFFHEAMVKAAKQNATVKRKNRWAIGFSGGIAASFAIWLFSAMMMPGFQGVHQESGSLSIALNETKNVSFVFNSTQRLDDAVITMILPSGIELVGFPTKRTLSWKTKLLEGKNLLTVPVVATGSQGGDFVAQVVAGNKRSEMRVKMSIAMAPDLGLGVGIKYSTINQT